MIRIQNIYHMLAYAFRALHANGFERVSAESFDHTADLFAAILIKGIGGQLKQGLQREYISHEDALALPRGKIDVSSSIKQLTPLRHQLACQYDEFTENTYMNRILKTTCQILIRSNDIEKHRRSELKRLMLPLAFLEILPVSEIHWGKMRFHPGNSTYKILMNVCHLVIEGLLATQENGAFKLTKYLDDQSMCRLYERFLLEYFFKHHPDLCPSSPSIEWNLDSGSNDFLPRMYSDIVLSYEGRTLIIDAKYYGYALTRSQYANHDTLHSGNLYQIYAYVKNADRARSGLVSGLLLYAKTDEPITPNASYQMDGNMIRVSTLDLDSDFCCIQKQLDSIACRFRDGLAV